MAATGTCPSCGAEFPADAPKGLCPGCLYRLGFSEAVQPEFPELSGEAFGPLEFEAVRSGTATHSFGGYELLERIGQGGMGVVYKARHKTLNRLVALKLLPLGPHASPESVKRFHAEAGSAAALQHPNIVAIHEVGFSDGQPFIAMEYIEGQSLASLAGGSPLRPQRAARYVTRVAQAIHHAHERGILHRDLKPANVLVDANDQPRVADFGLAKRLSETSDHGPETRDLTLTGQVLGSPNYMPPEQAAAKRGSLSRSSDVYGLGAILYYALTGRPPFLGDGLAETVQHVLTDDPVPPRALNPGIPRDLETVCLKCLEKEPVRRYPTAEALADELDRFLQGQPVMARPVGLAGREWRWCRRNPQVASLVAAVAVLFVSGFAGVVWQWRRAETGQALAGQRLYVSDMNLAQQALQANNPDRALELLNRHRPTRAALSDKLPAFIDVRGFEWWYLWQRCQTGAELIGRLPSGIRSLEVSRNGQWLLATSAKGAVQVWNLASGETLAVTSEGGTKGNGTFSPDSRLLFFTDQNLQSAGTIGVIDLQSRTRLSPITNEWWVGPMAFSPDGRRFSYGLCSRTFQRKVVVLDYPGRRFLCEGTCRTTFTDGHHGFCWVFTHDGRRIIGSENDPDRRIAIWDLEAGSAPEFFPGHREAITAMALSPDRQVLATAAGFTETAIRLWQVPSMQLLGELSGHERWVAGLAFSPDGRTLASAGSDQSLRLWNVANRRSTWVSPRLPQEVWRVCFAADGQTLFSGGQDGQVQRWHPWRRRTQEDFQRIPTGLTALTVASSATRFAGIRDGVVCLGETSGSNPPVRLEALGTNNTCVEFAAGDGLLLAGTRAGEVREWSIPFHQLQRSKGLSSEPVWALRHAAAGQILLVAQRQLRALEAGFPCRIRIWNGADWQERHSWVTPGLLPVCEVSPSGRWLALGDPYGPVRVWSPAHLQETEAISFPVGTTTAVVFSPDDRLLAVSCEEGYVSLWDLATKSKLTEFRAHHRAVRALAFSPDGRRLVTAGDGDEALKFWFWEALTGQELMTIACPGESLDGLGFSLDGHQLVARNSKGDLLVWRVAPTDQIEQGKR